MTTPPTSFHCPRHLLRRRELLDESNNTISDILFEPTNETNSPGLLECQQELEAKSSPELEVAMQHALLSMQPLSTSEISPNVGLLSSSETAEIINEVMGRQQLQRRSTASDISTGIMFQGQSYFDSNNAQASISEGLIPPETTGSRFLGSSSASDSSLTLQLASSTPTPSPGNNRQKRKTPEQIIESRLERRRERNRLAARKSRQRRLSYIQELEQRIDQYEGEMQRMISALRTSEQLIGELRSQLANKN